MVLNFKWNDLNHGYYGLLLIIFWCVFDFNWMWHGADWYWMVLIVGLILVIDEMFQLKYGQHSGPVHWLYINTLYRIKWVKELDDFLNRALK